jgi:hypothetical protein
MAEAKRQHDWNVASTIMALMAEMNRDRKRRRKPFKPDDFNPYAERKPIVAKGTVEQAASMLGAAYTRNTQISPLKSQASLCPKSKPEEPMSS